MENQQQRLPQRSQKSTMSNDKTAHISMLVSQSYNIFNRYGKDSTALRDITRAFIEDLSEYSIEDITAAFKSWRRCDSGMPTPANIINQINEGKSKSSKREKKYCDFDGDWIAYKRYLYSIGHLSDAVNRW